MIDLVIACNNYAQKSFFDNPECSVLLGWRALLAAAICCTAKAIIVDFTIILQALATRQQRQSQQAGGAA